MHIPERMMTMSQGQTRSNTFRSTRLPPNLVSTTSLQSSPSPANTVRSGRGQASSLTQVSASKQLPYVMNETQYAG